MIEGLSYLRKFKSYYGLKNCYNKLEQLIQNFEFVDLTEKTIPQTIVEMVPESVARENAVIPLSEEDGALKVLVSDPFDYETFEKLQFILNRKVDIALATRESSSRRLQACSFPA